MGLSASFGLMRCPECRGLLFYQGMDDIKIYDAECTECHRVWHVVKHQDGRTEIKPKTFS